MTDIDDRLRQSVASYLLKHDIDIFRECEAEEWIRADIEIIERLSPSQSDALIAMGVHAVYVSISRDWVPKRAVETESVTKDLRCPF